MSGNTYPYGSKEWQKHNEEEIASRPTAILKRRPFTTDEFEKLRSGTPMEEVLAARQQEGNSNGNAK
jgi:hypothetical protein